MNNKKFGAAHLEEDENGEPRVVCDIITTSDPDAMGKYLDLKAELQDIENLLQPHWQGSIEETISHMLGVLEVYQHTAEMLEYKKNTQTTPWLFLRECAINIIREQEELYQMRQKLNYYEQKLNNSRNIIKLWLGKKDDDWSFLVDIEDNLKHIIYVLDTYEEAAVLSGYDRKSDLKPWDYLVRYAETSANASTGLTIPRGAQGETSTIQTYSSTPFSEGDPFHKIGTTASNDQTPNDDDDSPATPPECLKDCIVYQCELRQTCKYNIFQTILKELRNNAHIISRQASDLLNPTLYSNLTLKQKLNGANMLLKLSAVLKNCNDILTTEAEEEPVVEKDYPNVRF
jgi:hypothetical protein